MFSGLYYRSLSLRPVDWLASLPDLIRFSPVQSIHLSDDFHVELRICGVGTGRREPRLAFDENGRMYVAEMVVYPKATRGPHKQIPYRPQT